MPRVPTAVCYVEKFKLNGSNVQHVYDHNIRRDVPENAHRELLPLDRIYIDQPEGKKVRDYLDDELYKLKVEHANPNTIRKDAVGTVAVILRADNVFLKDGKPPEWFDLEGWVQDSMNWADETFNPKNHEIRFRDENNEPQVRTIQTIYSAVLHLDEANPHLHLLIMPIDERGHLNVKGTAANYLYSRMQTSYHQAVEKYGLQRGEIASPARAKNISKYHANLERIMSQEAPEIIPGETIEAYRERANDAIQVCNSHMLEQDREHEHELNAAKAEKNRYVREDYKLHGAINTIIGNGNGKDIDLEKIREIAKNSEQYQKIEKAIRLYPDREFADIMEQDLQHLIEWMEEQERQVEEERRKEREKEQEREEREEEEELWE